MWDKKKWDSYKELVFENYGKRCVCCGESVRKFLTLDHINNDGNARRRSGQAWYLWLVNQGFPKDIQVLCFNCNCGKALNQGTCPHKTVS